MSSNDISLVTDGVTVVNAPLLNSYRAAIAAIETGATPLNNASLTGVPNAPTAAPGTNTTQVASAAFVHAAVSLLAPLANPTFTGIPAVPTATGGTNTTQAASTAFVTTAVSGKAPLANPTFTGTPAAPTATTGANTTQLATTAFVHGEIAAIPSPLPAASMGNLLAGNGSNAWAALSASLAMDGDVLMKDHTSPFGLRWGSIPSMPGGATLGSVPTHDATTGWGTVTPNADNQLLVSDDASGFGVKFAAIDVLPTATQMFDYAALTTDADRVAYIASYLGLV